MEEDRARNINPDLPLYKHLFIIFGWTGPGRVGRMVHGFRGRNTCLRWPPEDQGWRDMEFCFPDRTWC
jgi:hypothetical protein